MFNSDDEDGLGLLSENHEVDLIVNLVGQNEAEAVKLVQQEINRNKKPKGESKIWLSFPLANGEGPTLFAPIGAVLRENLKNGNITRAMPAKNGGWIIRL